MKVLNISLTGEGPTDFGWFDPTAREWKEGAAAKLIRNCASEKDVSVTIEFVEKQVIGNMKLQRKALKGLEGHAIPARKFYVCMKERRQEFGIYYCDADDRILVVVGYQSISGCIWQTGSRQESY